MHGGTGTDHSDCKTPRTAGDDDWKEKRR